MDKASASGAGDRGFKSRFGCAIFEPMSRTSCHHTLTPCVDELRFFRKKLMIPSAVLWAARCRHRSPPTPCSTALGFILLLLLSCSITKPFACALAAARSASGASSPAHRAPHQTNVGVERNGPTARETASFFNQFELLRFSRCQPSTHRYFCTPLSCSSFFACLRCLV